LRTVPPDRWSRQCHHIAAPHGQVQAVQGGDLTEVLGDGPKVDGGFAHAANARFALVGALV
jgi:hypothetical protein